MNFERDNRLIGMVIVLFGALSLWMSSLRISYGHCLKSAYGQVFVVSRTIVRGHYIFKRSKTAWKNPLYAQEEYLKDIIKSNSNTLYVKNFGLNSVTSLKDLQAKHPLTIYEDYRRYIDRMTRGEEDVLMGEPLVRFGVTSGTTGNAKMWPYGKSFTGILSHSNMLNMHNRLAAFGSGCFLQREMRFHTAPKRSFSESGIPIGPTSMMTSSESRSLVMYSTPTEGFQIENPYDALYVHLLFGLRDQNLRSIRCSFTSTLMSAMRMLEQLWPDFVHDIEYGTVTIRNVPSGIYQVLVREMGGGNLKRAADLKREFGNGFDGIVQRVWPGLLFAQATDAHGIKEALRKSYFKGVPIFSRVLGATEGIIGINLWPMRTRDEFVLMPDMCVMEFIPEENIHEVQSYTLLIHELRVGGVYEIVLSQKFGVYRFRHGDVIRVTRFHFNTPVVEFMYRAGETLNVRGEKLNQRIVKAALEAVVEQWSGVQLDNYTTAESFLLDKHAEPGAADCPFYVVFLELHPINDKQNLANIQLEKVDEELRRHCSAYNVHREEGSMAPPCVHIVKPGTFDRLFAFILDNSTTSANQYKVPRKLRTAETLKLMLESSISHYSGSAAVTGREVLR